jgi:hypothetical protein
VELALAREGGLAMRGQTSSTTSTSQEETQLPVSTAIELSPEELRTMLVHLVLDQLPPSLDDGTGSLRTIVECAVADGSVVPQTDLRDPVALAAWRREAVATITAIVRQARIDWALERDRELVELDPRAIARRLAVAHLGAIGWRPAVGTDDRALALGYEAWGGCPDGLTQEAWNDLCCREVRRAAQEAWRTASTSKED